MTSANGSSDGQFFGHRVGRIEDAQLLRGTSKFVDDIEIPGLFHAVFVRSPVAHARLIHVNSTRARSLSGVRAVLTYDDLRPLLACDRIPQALQSTAIRFDVDPVALARDE